MGILLERLATISHYQSILLIPHPHIDDASPNMKRGGISETCIVQATREQSNARQDSYCMAMVCQSVVGKLTRDLLIPH